MKKKKIEALYYGNVIPFEKSFSKNSPYGKINHQTSEVRDELEKTLNEEELKLLNQYADLHGQSASILEFESFLSGFRLATRLLCEALVGKDNE